MSGVCSVGRGVDPLRHTKVYTQGFAGMVVLLGALLLALNLPKVV